MATVLSIPLSQPVHNLQELDLQLRTDICQGIANLIPLKSSQGLLESEINCFCSATTPAISVTDYLARFYSYGKFSATCLFGAQIYLKRFATATRQQLHDRNIHRLIACAVLCAVKFMEDNIHNNRLHAEIAGISLQEMNSLESTFLSVLDYNLSLPEFQGVMYSQMENFNNL